MRKLLMLIVTVVIALPLIFGFSMVGCKSSAEEVVKEDTTEEAVDEEAAEEEAIEEETTEEEKTAELKDEYLIGFSQRWGVAPFLKTIELGIRDRAKEWEEKLGVEIEVLSTDAGLDDPSQQVRDMEDIYAQQPDGLLLFPGDSTVVVDPLKNLYNANDIPVVITDIGVDGGEYVSIIITNNTEAGKLGGQAMVDLAEPGSKVISLNHAIGNNNVKARVEGFSTICEENGFNVLGEKEVVYTIEASKQLTEDLLTSDPDLGGIFTVGNVTASGAASALEELGNTSTIIVGFDLDSTTLQQVKDGMIDAVVVQNPYFMGTEGMNQMMYYLTGQTDMIEHHIDSEISLLTMDNASDYDDDPQVTLE